MKITIVTPSFNQGRFIGKTIESIWSQAGDFHIEHIIMDGGSTDETIEVIKRYEAALPSYPVRCKGLTFKWVSEKDRGQSDAINKGFRQASGDYIAWLNSDDVYESGAVRKALINFAIYPDMEMFYGEGYYVYEPRGNKTRYPVKFPFQHKMLADYCYITQPAVFLRREVLEKVGYLDESLHYCMDYDWWIRIGKVCKVGYIPEYLASTRVYPETKTESGREKAVEEAIRTVLKHYGYIPLTWQSCRDSARLHKYIPHGSLPHTALIESLFLIRKAIETRGIPWQHIRRVMNRRAV